MSFICLFLLLIARFSIFFSIFACKDVRNSCPRYPSFDPVVLS